jgi:enoyl-CoA hydratase/carnithine racemase
MGLVTVERSRGVAVLSYANPPLGTMTAVGAAELLLETQGAAADPEVRCLVFTGGLPDVFIRHYDVEEVSAGAEMRAETPRPVPGHEVGAFNRLTDLVAEMPKPTIAAINGLCMGGGFEFALACDIRIASESVRGIGLPETRVGIFPAGGGTQRLPRVIGEAKALEMILRGSVVNALQALEIGMVHEIAPDALTRARDIGLELAALPRGGLAEAKRLTRLALERPLQLGFADERQSFVRLVETPEAREALQAWIAANPVKRD